MTGLHHLAKCQQAYISFYTQLKRYGLLMSYIIVIIVYVCQKEGSSLAIAAPPILQKEGSGEHQYNK